MGLTSLLSFVAIAGVLMVLGGALIAGSNMTQNRSPRGGLALAGAGVVIALIFFVASSGLVSVGATEVAVVFQQLGGNAATNSLWDKPLGPGVHVILPIVNQPVIYSTESRNYTMSGSSDEGSRAGDDAVEARTSDGQLVKVDVAVFYNIDPTTVNQLHIKWQNRFENDFVRPTTRSIIRQIMADYTVGDIYSGAALASQPTGSGAIVAQPSKMPEMEKKMFDDMVPEFEANGLTLQNVLLRNITFSDEFLKAIEARQVAEQQAQQAELEANRKRTIAQGDADSEVTAAKGDAQANIERARGDAESIVLRADAEAKALDAISKQLAANPSLIQWRYIEKLASDIKLILIPSSSPYLFDLASLQAQAEAGTGAAAQTATPTP
jgi:regulator of protease activity HflC (stomatin/prohibitin superfamily)